MRLSARLKRLVERELDSIVELAEKGVEESGAAKGKTEEKESQFHNLQNLASATDSVLVLESFIRYQIGREKIDKEVGERILNDLEVLGERAKAIAERENFKESDEFRTFRMELVRLYLGFFVRALKARRENRG